MSMNNDLFPLTIIRDPHDGKYSGGKYLAINQNYDSTSPYINECEDFSKDWWENESHNYIIGVGETAEEAQADLYNKLLPKDEGKKIEKYLFLDFDGVLNTGNYQKKMKEEGIDAYDEYGPMFDPQAVSYLEQIIDRTGCKIVISSTWRNEGIARMQQMWKDRGMPGTIYSMTPILMSVTFRDALNGDIISAPAKTAKALEIDMWLQRHASKDARYAIIDDESIRMNEDDYLHMVNTDEQIGIDIYAVNSAVLALNGEPNEMKHEY